LSRRIFGATADAGMRTKGFVASAAIALALALSGCGGSSDDEPAAAALAGTLQLMSDALRVSEGSGVANVLITRTGGSSGAVSATLSVVGGSASIGSDVTATTKTVVFADGDAATKTITISLLDDGEDEADEVFTARLSTVNGGATLGSPASAIITIADDDDADVRTHRVAGTVSGLSGTVALRNNGADELRIDANGVFTFPIQVTEGQPYAVTVVTQPAGQDCTVARASGILRTSDVIDVAVTCSGGTPPPPPPPSPGKLQLLSTTLSVAEHDGTANVIVTRTDGTRGEVGVTLATSADSATADADYTTTSTTVTFADGDATAKIVPIPVLDDSIDELDETFTVTLSTATGGATLGSVTGSTVTVTDDDALALASSNPANESVAADRTGTIQLTFTTPIEAASVVGQITLAVSSNDQAVELESVAVNATQVTLTPKRKLSPLTRYAVLIAAGIRNTAGDALATATNVGFTTRDGEWQQAEAIEPNDAPILVSPRTANPRIAMNPGGHAMVVWQQLADDQSKVWSSRYVPGEGWRSPARLAPPPNDDRSFQFGPAVAIDALGNAVAVWTLHSENGPYGSLVANRNSGADVWSVGENVASDAQAVVGRFPQIAMDATGNAIAVWAQQTSTSGAPTHFGIWANRHVNGDGWGVPTLLETDHIHDALSPQIAIDAEGNAFVVWTQFDGLRDRIWANRFEAESGRWGTAALIETNGARFVLQLQIASNPNGFGGFVVWRQSGPGVSEVWTNNCARGAGGCWIDSERVEQTKQVGDGDSSEPNVAVDAKGNALAVWAEIAGGRESIWSNRYEAESQSWGTPLVIEASDGNVSNPQVAFDAQGNALAVWEQTGSRPITDIWALRYVAATKQWGAAALIEVGDEPAVYPQIVIDAQGNALAVWSQHDADGPLKIWSNRFE
jgi:hypothetical protein